MTTTPLPQMLAEALHEHHGGDAGCYHSEAQEDRVPFKTCEYDAAALLATPALAPLLALVEAAAKWRDKNPSILTVSDSLTALELLNAVDAFRGSPDR